MQNWSKIESSIPFFRSKVQKWKSLNVKILSYFKVVGAISDHLYFLAKLPFWVGANLHHFVRAKTSKKSRSKHVPPAKYYLNHDLLSQVHIGTYRYIYVEWNSVPTFLRDCVISTYFFPYIYLSIQIANLNNKLKGVWKHYICSQKMVRNSFEHGAWRIWSSIFP